MEPSSSCTRTRPPRSVLPVPPQNTGISFLASSDFCSLSTKSSGTSAVIFPEARGGAGTCAIPAGGTNAAASSKNPLSHREKISGLIFLPARPSAAVSAKPQPGFHGCLLGPTTGSAPESLLRSPFPGSSSSRGRAVGPYRRNCRSEEHTSELQSPCNLVCRLLLEKKKAEPVHERLDL